MIWDTFNAGFWITITTLLTGSIALGLKYCLKSKCDSINVCYGLLKIHRNVELETIDIENNNNIEENKI
jgi:hypothetical protein